MESFILEPRRHLKQGGLRVFAFNGKTKEYQAKLDLTIDAPLADINSFLEITLNLSVKKF